MFSQLKPKTFIFMDRVAYGWGRYGCLSPSAKGLHVRMVCLESLEWLLPVIVGWQKRRWIV